MTNLLRRFSVVFVVLTVVLPTLALAADGVKWTLTLGDPLRDTMGPSSERRQKMAELAATRLERRLKVAQVNDAVVKRLASGDLTVAFKARQPEEWYRGLLLSPGTVEIRPVLADGFNWMQLAAELPPAVELRGLNPQPDYIWSADRTTLESVVRRTAAPAMVFSVGPAEVGWRSYALGTANVLKGEELRDARVSRSGAGNSYVSLGVATTVADRLAAAELSEVKEWAVVLDGEVVSLVSKDALLTGKLELTAPVRLTNREDSAAWARQVAGRMAAPIPVPIAVLQE